MAMFSDGGVSSPDIWIVVGLILISTVSVVLNPLVFRHNFNKRKTVARDLYMALSSADFMSCLILPATFSVRTLAPKEDQCQKIYGLQFCQEKYYNYTRQATIAEKTLGSVTWSITMTPLIITSVLTMCRWYQIKYPLRHLSRTGVQITTGVICSLWSIYYTVAFFWDSPKYPTVKITFIQTVWNQTPFGGRMKDFENISVDKIAVVLLTIPATLASIITVYQVITTKPVPGTPEALSYNKKVVSTVKIALLNAGSVLLVSLLIGLTAISSYFHIIFTITVVFAPVFISAINPIIYLLLTKGVLTINRN